MAIYPTILGSARLGADPAQAQADAEQAWLKRELIEAQTRGESWSSVGVQRGTTSASGQSNIGDDIANFFGGLARSFVGGGQQPAPETTNWPLIAGVGAAVVLGGILLFKR